MGSEKSNLTWRGKRATARSVVKSHPPPPNFMTNTTKEFYTWQKYQKDIQALAIKLSENPKYIFDSIYGIPRGGLVVAVSLSHALNLPMVEVNNITNKTLVVDDIIDSGETMQKLLNYLDDKTIEPIIASLYYREGALVKPDEYMRLKRRWVVFSSENKSSSKYY